VGKISFAPDHIVENLMTLLRAVSRSKPASSKGIFLRSMYLSTTMGPGLKIDLQTLALGSGEGR
jgi:large subunit ribosomal protein L1